MSEKKDKSKIDNEADNVDEKVVETEKISDEDSNDLNVNELNEPDDGNNKIDLENQILVDKVEIGKQAGGIAFWKKDI